MIASTSPHVQDKSQEIEELVLVKGDVLVLGNQHSPLLGKHRSSDTEDTSLQEGTAVGGCWVISELLPNPPIL